MATLNIPHSFTAGTAAVASQVNSNFTAVKNFVEAIASGTNIDSGAVTAAKLAADVNNLFVPVGGVMPYAGSTAPAGGKWMLADGSAISRTSYATLFAAIGTTYGAGDTVTTFNLPNLKGRVVVGLDATQTEFDALAETGGAKTHTLTIAQMPAHTHLQNPHDHTQNPHNHAINAARTMNENSINGNSTLDVDSAWGLASPETEATAPATPSINSATATNMYTGENAPHNNLQPYVVLNYLIRVI